MGTGLAGLTTLLTKPVTYIMTTPEMRPAIVPPIALSQPASRPDRFSPMGRVLLDRVGPSESGPRIRNRQAPVQGGLSPLNPGRLGTDQPRACRHEEKRQRYEEDHLGRRPFVLRDQAEAEDTAHGGDQQKQDSPAQHGRPPSFERYPRIECKGH